MHGIINLGQMDVLPVPSRNAEIAAILLNYSTQVASQQFQVCLITQHPSSQ